MGNAWDKLRVPLAHLIYLFLGIFGCSLSIAQLYGGPLHFSFYGIGDKLLYTHHSQLYSKKNLWNEKVAKEPNSSQTAK